MATLSITYQLVLQTVMMVQVDLQWLAPVLVLQLPHTDLRHLLMAVRNFQVFQAQLQQQVLGVIMVCFHPMIMAMPLLLLNMKD